METIATHRFGRAIGRVVAILVVVVAAAFGVTVLAQSSNLERTLKDHGTVLSFIFTVSLVLIFVLGYGIRDGLQKRGLRLRPASDPDTIPRRP